MPGEQERPPLEPGESAPDFTLPAADREGSVTLDELQGRPLLLTLMRGVQCPFCRRNVARFGQMAPKLRELGVETLAIIGTSAERARLYFSYRPTSILLAADQELETHRRYGIPCYPMTPEIIDQLKSTRVDPFNELPEPVPLMDSNGVECHHIFDRLDGFEPNETDQRDRTRQAHEAVQLCGQYMLDAEGIIRWAHVEGEQGLESAGIFPDEATVLAVAKNL